MLIGSAAVTVAFQPMAAIFLALSRSSYRTLEGKIMAEEKKLDRTTCGILAILLGGFGVHKFMMGQTTAGIITIFLSLCTCTGGFIGMIEGIIYLTKTDEEFYQTYVVEKKAWF
jgi:TM2 domain-containing membrane protein YozV